MQDNEEDFKGPLTMKYRLINLRYRVPFIARNWRKLLARRLYTEPEVWKFVEIPVTLYEPLPAGAWTLSAWVSGPMVSNVVLERPAKFGQVLAPGYAGESIRWLDGRPQSSGVKP